MNDLLVMCLEFMKTGLFAIGGGLATLPYLMRMSVDHPNWFSLDQLMNMIAVSESTPGPIGVNMSTYVGFAVHGVPGAILATLSVVLPSFVIILLVVRVLDRYRESRLVAGAMESLHAAVTGLIAAAGFSVVRISLLRQTEAGLTILWVPVALFGVFLLLTQLPATKKIHPLFYILAGGVLGVVLGL